MIIVGILCAVVGYLLGIGLLTTIGLILLGIGLVLLLLGAAGRPVAGRRWY